MTIVPDPSAASAVTFPDLALNLRGNVMRIGRRFGFRLRFVGLCRSPFFLSFDEAVGHRFENRLPLPSRILVAGELASSPHLRHDAIGEARVHEPVVGGHGLESDGPRGYDRCHWSRRSHWKVLLSR